MKFLFSSLLFAITLAASAVLADSEPAAFVAGDWDLGPKAVALRILSNQNGSIDVLYCKREPLVARRVCTHDVMLNFTYSEADSAFVYAQETGSKLHAVIKFNAADPQHIQYSFQNSWSAGEKRGERL
jgi:hypothetical protein